MLSDPSEACRSRRWRGHLTAGLTVLVNGLGCHTVPATAPVPADPVTVSTAAEPAPAAEPERFFVEIGDAPFRGPSDAPVTIVMFSDFECPYCALGHSTMNHLLEAYPDQVRVVYKAFPLDMHPHAMLAAMAARSAQSQGSFWSFHDQLFSQKGIDPERILAYATQANLDTDAMIKDIESLRFGPHVSRELRQGRKLGVTSTPTFFVNGRVMQGAKSEAEFGELIEDELARAEAWRAEGIAADAIYAHAIADGYRQVVYEGEGPALSPDAVVPIPIEGSPTRGPDNAMITIVAFEDFECQFCARGNEILEHLTTVYPDNVRIVFKQFPLPFHSHAVMAARASLAAHRQGKFWPFHDALYQRHAQFDDEDLAEIAQSIGLDMDAFDNDLDRFDIRKTIEADLELGMARGITGTPTYFINGRAIEGARDLLHFRLIIEEELQRATAALSRGVQPADLYETLTHEPLE